MPKNFEHLLDAYQGNCYPAMTEYLAHDLGVSANSLLRLGIGYAPIVIFKRGPSFAGWWVIPERDDFAVPIGLSLRGMDGTKTMLPSSNHGFIYEVSPTHSSQAERYHAGPQNWVRTMDAGRLCPVCNKPDGCLLSAENPESPRAVVCIREKSPKPLRFGYLHVLRPEGHLHSASALVESTGPVLVVEGMSDTATAMDLGYVAVGRPSNLAKLDMLAEIVRGRRVIVIGENDRKPDGREPGREGMIAAFQACKKTAPIVSMLMPPPHVKDLRAWVVKYQLDRAGFEAYLAEHEQLQAAEMVIDNPMPLTVAKAWLRSSYRASGRTTLRNYRGEWYRYINGRYVPAAAAGLRAEVYQWSDGKLAMHETTKGAVPKPLQCGPPLVTGVLDAALSEAHIEADSVPAWINQARGARPEDLIVFSNGMLDVPQYLAGNEGLIDLTPDFFTLFGMPYSFDPTAKCPQWLAFLGQVLGDDEKKITLLREWMGYNLVPDISMHKMMLMVGPPRSGKGTVLGVLQNVLGQHQVSATTFKQLTSQFGLAPLVGSLAAIMGDAHLSRHADGMNALEVLKGVVGGDSQGVDVKYKEGHRSLQLKTRFTISVNELPELPDFAGAMIPRLNVLDFKHSFQGREDYELPTRLATETSGITLWALQGLAALRNSGRFTVPDSSNTVLTEWSRLTNPIASFLEETTERNDTDNETKDSLFDAWEKWRSARNVAGMTKSRFFERLKANAPYVISETFEDNGEKVGVFLGLTFKPWAVKKLLGRPS